jgi:hypothetical protein
VAYLIYSLTRKVQVQQNVFNRDNLFLGRIIMAEVDDADHNADEDLGEFVKEERGGLMMTVVTGAAVAILAPELLPGMAIGVAALLAPKVLPVLGTAVRPLVRTAVRAGYSAVMETRELVAEAAEQVQDIVAEARSDQENGKRGSRTRRPAKQPAKRRTAHA